MLTFHMGIRIRITYPKSKHLACDIDTAFGHKAHSRKEFWRNSQLLSALPINFVYPTTFTSAAGFLVIVLCQVLQV
jgi:hypothetical protein